MFVLFPMFLNFAHHFFFFFFTQGMSSNSQIKGRREMLKGSWALPAASMRQAVVISPPARHRFASFSSAFMMDIPPWALYCWATSVSFQILPFSSIGKEDNCTQNLASGYSCMWILSGQAVSWILHNNAFKKELIQAAMTVLILCYFNMNRYSFSHSRTSRKIHLICKSGFQPFQNS